MRKLVSLTTHPETFPLPHHSGLIEKRVLIFRLLRSALCEALARVQAAAALLYLQQQPAAPRLPGAAGAAAAAAGAPAVVASAAPPGGGVGHAASAADIAAAAAAEEGLFQRADRLVTASLAEVAEAFAALDRSVHATLDAQQGPAAPPVDDQQVRLVWTFFPLVAWLTGLAWLVSQVHTARQPGTSCPPGFATLQWSWLQT